jgi:hypothetical protein
MRVLLLRIFPLLLLLQLCASALAEKIVDSSCFTLVTEGSDYFVVTTPESAKVSKPKLEKMFLTNPSRAVVDLVGLKCTIARSIGLSDSGVVSTVRVGSHSDRIRIVFELLPKTRRNLVYNQLGNKIRIKIGGPDDEAPADLIHPIETPVKEVTPPVKEIVPLAKVETKPKLVHSTEGVSTTDKNRPSTYEVVDNVIKEKKMAEDSQAAVPQFHATEGVESAKLADAVPVKIETMPVETPPTETPKLEKSQPLVPGRTEVRAIYFQLTKSGSAPAAVIDLSAVVPYILTKRREDLYEVDIDNAQLSGRHLLLPQFPPDNFTGFSAVIAQEVAGKVTIQIFVEEGMQLLPFTAEGKLWVRIGRK